MADTSVYENPLLSRYASREMAENFSDDKKFRLWRKLWIALAEAEKEMGLHITEEQIAEMKEYADDINIPAGISCRVGDSSDERLVIQYHPDDIFARERIGIHFGKTEAWYIAAVRGDSSYCLAGFRNGISKSEFVNAFYDGDSKSIEQMMHRIDFMKGDTILIPAGMIHAMGPETTFLEIHNPCDYTFRLERSIAGRKLKDEEIHYGLGFDALIDGLSFRTYTEEEVMSETVFHPEPIGIYGDIRRFTIIPYSRNASFRIDKLKISGKGTIKGLDCHMLLVAVSNDTFHSKQFGRFNGVSRQKLRYIAIITYMEVEVVLIHFVLFGLFSD